MRYYIIGSKINDRKNSTFFGDLPNNLDIKGTLLASLQAQSQARLFKSFDEAKEYAHGLRENANGYSQYPNYLTEQSKVHPIFTLELNQCSMLPYIELGEEKCEQFQYFEHIYSINQDDYVETPQIKEVTLHFYEISLSLLKIEHFIRVEFYKSALGTVALHASERDSSCAIM